MLPIPGETYDEYLRRVTDAGEIPLLMQELRDLGWQELPSGELWIAQLGGEPEPVGPPAFPPEITEEPAEQEEEPITLVTVYFLVWCINTESGERVGPFTQMLDVDWYAVTIQDIIDQVDAAAKAFCEGMLHPTMGLAPNVGMYDDYDWEIISPFGIRYSRGI